MRRLRCKKILNSRAALAGTAASFAVFGLASCDTSQYVAGIDGSGARIYAQGPIEAFGSIVLNGVHYDVSRAEIRINGEPATEAGLAVGQLVTIMATDFAGAGIVADSVNFEANVRGPVAAVDPVAGSLSVLEQEIRVGSGTALNLGAGNGLDSLVPGEAVEVSGLMGTGGIIEATYLTRAPADEGLRVIGHVTALDPAARTFMLGSLAVNYAGAGLIEGFPTGGPIVGDAVLAEGSSLNGGGALLASRLERLDSGAEPGREGQEAEIEGLITRFASVTDFDVAGKPAMTTPTTVYEGGSSADLGLNVKIQVEGHFDALGTIVARKVEVKDGVIAR